MCLSLHEWPDPTSHSWYDIRKRKLPNALTENVLELVLEGIPWPKHLFPLRPEPCSPTRRRVYERPRSRTGNSIPLRREHESRAVHGTCKCAVSSRVKSGTRGLDRRRFKPHWNSICVSSFFNQTGKTAYYFSSLFTYLQKALSQTLSCEEVFGETCQSPCHRRTCLIPGSFFQIFFFIAQKRFNVALICHSELATWPLKRQEGARNSSVGISTACFVLLKVSSRGKTQIPRIVLGLV